MKKIVLTTEQMNKISEYVQTEGSTESLNESLDNNRYEMECDVDLNYGGLKFQGNDVDDVNSSKIRVTYLIELEHRSWGIKSISLYDIKGPEELELEVYYYDGDKDDTLDTMVTVKLDWDGIDTDTHNGSFIGLDSDLEFDLENDSEGNIICTGISGVVYSI